ncbi:MAG: hypothetical protein AAFU03_19070, partial [Bacteroidota bacterium]
MYDSNDVPSWEFNGQAYASPWPWIVRAGIQMIVIDSINNDRWLTNPPGGAHGSTSNGSPQDVWGYDTRTQEGRAAMMDFIDNVVEDGKYVVLYTSQRGNDLDYKASEWINDSLVLGQTLFGVLERQGALQVRQLANLGAVPYVFAFQKGVGPIGEDLAESQEGVADLLFNIGFNWPEGKWDVPDLGPALSWETIDLQFLENQITASDSARLLIYGRRNRTTERESVMTYPLRISELTDFTFDISSSKSSSVKLNHGKSEAEIEEIS